jgi:uncharacterized membrane protein
MSNNMNTGYTKLAVIIAVVSTAAVTTAISTSFQIAEAILATDTALKTPKRAPVATSGDKNVYVAWWSNKTGNDEVMFKASIDGGKTFSDKMNLSNSPNAQSQDVQIAASGNNVYVTWWERNQTANEPILRVSNDNGKSFGERIMLSAK